MGLTSPSKATCAALSLLNPGGRIALSGSYFKATVTPGGIPFVNAEVRLPELLRMLLLPCPGSVVSREGLASHMLSGPCGHS